MGREKRGWFKREETYVYPWLTHVDISQKTTKFCKSIILQLKNNFKKCVHSRGGGDFTHCVMLVVTSL